MSVTRVASRYVFIGDTYYQSWRAYLKRLVPADQWTDFKKRVPDFTAFSQLSGSNFPVRRKEMLFDTVFPTIEKHVRGTGTTPSKQYTTIETTDGLCFDINVGKFNGRWIGGPFYTFKKRKRVKPSTRRDHRSSPYLISEWLGGPGKFWYSDQVNLDITSYLGDCGISGVKCSGDPRDLFSAFQLASSYAVGARNNSDPGRAMFSFGQTVAELRDLPRLLKLAGDNFISQGASAYLSYEFGWKPLVKDLRSLFNFSTSIKKRLEWLKKNEGKLVRRSRLLYDIKGTPQTLRSLTFTNSLGYGDAAVKAGTYPIIDEYRTRAWYKSTIRFDIPDEIPEWRWEREATRILMGIQPDGKLLWDITPWSWLIDWFTIIGDLVEKEFGSSATSTQFISEWIMVNIQTKSFCEVPALWRAKAADPAEEAGSASCTNITECKARQVPTTVATSLLRLENLLSTRQSAILFALFAARVKWSQMDK